MSKRLQEGFQGSRAEGPSNPSLIQEATAKALSILVERQDFRKDRSTKMWSSGKVVLSVRQEPGGSSWLLEDLKEELGQPPTTSPGLSGRWAQNGNWDSGLGE